MIWSKAFVGCMLLMAVAVSSCSDTTEEKRETVDNHQNSDELANAEKDVKMALSQQQDAWNDGDLEGFMAWYEDSDKLSFVTVKGLTQGNKNLLERYKKSYPDKVSMGKLEFEIMEYRPLGIANALVIGRWRLDRETGSPSGYFTLVWEKTTEGWRIINDHTS